MQRTERVWGCGEVRAGVLQYLGHKNECNYVGSFEVKSLPEILSRYEADHWARFVSGAPSACGDPMSHFGLQKSCLDSS